MYNSFRFLKEHCCLEGLFASPVWLSGKSKIWTKMSSERWWSDTDRGNRITRRKRCRCARQLELYLKIQFVPRSKQSLVYKSKQGNNHSLY